MRRRRALECGSVDASAGSTRLTRGDQAHRLTGIAQSQPPRQSDEPPIDRFVLRDYAPQRTGGIAQPAALDTPVPRHSGAWGCSGRLQLRGARRTRAPFARSESNRRGDARAPTCDGQRASKPSGAGFNQRARGDPMSADSTHTHSADERLSCGPPMPAPPGAVRPGDQHRVLVIGLVGGQVLALAGRRLQHRLHAHERRASLGSQLAQHPSPMPSVFTSHRDPGIAGPGAALRSPVQRGTEIPGLAPQRAPCQDLES